MEKVRRLGENLETLGLRALWVNLQEVNIKIERIEQRRGRGHSRPAVSSRIRVCILDERDEYLVRVYVCYNSPSYIPVQPWRQPLRETNLSAGGEYCRCGKSLRSTKRDLSDLDKSISFRELLTLGPAWEVPTLGVTSSEFRRYGRAQGWG